MTPTLTQSLGLSTRQFLNEAHRTQSSFDKHFEGRFRLMGTALVGTVEIISRLAFFLLGNIAGIFSLYQSDDINRFLKDQTEAGFTASILTSASFFALLSPDLFRGVALPQERMEEERIRVREVEQQRVPVEEQIREEEVLNNRGIQQEQEIEDRRIDDLIASVVELPFRMLAFCFKLPFYAIYYSFQIGVILPIRLTLLPWEIFISALTTRRPRRDPIGLDLV